MPPEGGGALAEKGKQELGWGRRGGGQGGCCGFSAHARPMPPASALQLLPGE